MCVIWPGCWRSFAQLNDSRGHQDRRGGQPKLPCLPSLQAQLHYPPCLPPPLPLSVLAVQAVIQEMLCCSEAEPLKHTVNVGVNNDKAGSHTAVIFCYFFYLYLYKLGLLSTNFCCFSLTLQHTVTPGSCLLYSLFYSFPILQFHSRSEAYCLIIREDSFISQIVILWN